MTIEYKSLTNLKIARENTRKTRSKDQIDTLADSIRAVGLLHTLVGYEDKGMTHITDGGSRLKALRVIDKGEENFDDLLANIPVTICPKEQAIDVSLTANLVRNAMTPTDQYTAFHNLHRKQGVEIEEIAKRYYVDSATVRRILKLAELAKPIFQALKEGEISLDAAKAYAGCSDQDRQLAVFETCGLDANAYMIRRQLRENSYLADSACVSFVTLDAYKERGGVIETDLFEDQTLLPDGHIIDELMVEAVEANNQALLDKGWGEVRYFDDRSSLYDAATQYGARLSPSFDPTEDQQSRLDVLEKEIEAFGYYWNLSADDQKRHQVLNAEYEAIEQAASSFDPDIMDKAICLWSFSESGPSYQFHLLMDETKAQDRKPKIQRDYSESFERNVFATAGDALFEHLTLNPHAVTLSLVIAALEFGHFPALDLSKKSRPKLKFTREGEAIVELDTGDQNSWGTSDQDKIARLKELTKMDDVERLGILAGLLRSSFKMGEQASDLSDQLALFQFMSDHTEFSLTDYWTFGEEELSCLTKAQLLRVLGRLGLNPSAFDKAKKSELVKVAARYASEQKWLPEFITDVTTDEIESAEDEPLAEAA